MVKTRAGRAQAVCLRLFVPWLAANLILFSPTVCRTAPEASLSSHWGYQVVCEGLARGLLRGYPDGTVQPDRILTRAEFCAMLTRVAGEEDAASVLQKMPSSFPDVTMDYWAKGYLEVARDLELIVGENGLAIPERAISRAETVAMLDRFLHGQGLDAAVSSLRFGDSADVPGWALDALGRLVSLGVMKGDERGLCRPLDHITRAEAMALLARGLSCLGSRWDMIGTVVGLGDDASVMSLLVQGQRVTVPVDPERVLVFENEAPVNSSRLTTGVTLGILLSRGSPVTALLVSITTRGN